jgi:hypothetical protein
MAYDTARGRVTLFGGRGVGPGTATPADLLADTWELPVGAPEPGEPGEPDPGPGPGSAIPKLVSFTITPAVAGPEDSFTIAVSIDRVAVVPAEVTLEIGGSGAVGHLVIAPGQAWVAETAQPGSFPPGSYTLTATLGEVSLSATFVVQE